MICTYEKTFQILTRLHEENRMNELGVVVVDEVHMLADPSRGYLLECILAQLLFLRRRVAAPRSGIEDQALGGVPGSRVGRGPQLVAMSATLSNPHELSAWLDAGTASKAVSRWARRKSRGDA